MREEEELGQPGVLEVACARAHRWIRPQSAEDLASGGSCGSGNWKSTTCERLRDSGSQGVGRSCLRAYSRPVQILGTARSFR